MKEFKIYRKDQRRNGDVQGEGSTENVEDRDLDCDSGLFLGTSLRAEEGRVGEPALTSRLLLHLWESLLQAAHCGRWGQGGSDSPQPPIP